MIRAALCTLTCLLAFEAQAAWLTTPDIAPDDDHYNYGAGLFFDLENRSTSNMTLTGRFTTMLYDDRDTDVMLNVFYKSGTFVGYETNAAAWTPLGSATVTSLGKTDPVAFDVGSSFELPAGQIFGLYLTTGDYYDSLAYTTTENPGGLWASDGVLAIYEGTNLDVFGDTPEDWFSGYLSSPRGFNGSIEYQVPSPSTAMLLPLAGGLLTWSRRRAAGRALQPA